jgi:Rod binding domain-containing protein
MDNKINSPTSLGFQFKDTKKPIDYPANKKINDYNYIPEPYKKVARNMEGEFIKLMLNKMQDTVGLEEEKDSATQYYQDLLLDERSKIMSKKDRGLGLQEVILNEIYPKRMRNETSYNNYLRNIEHQKRNQKITLGNKKDDK